MVERERIHPETRREWRRWLEANHDRSDGIEVVQWRTATGKRQVSYEDLVEEALCFGWIDSRTGTIDDQRSLITMTPRRPGGMWARSNKERVDRLIAQGLMTDAGQRVIDAAKANGSWSMLDDIDAMVIPDDLAAALAAEPVAQRHFEAFPPSARKQALYWIKSAKRAETRRRRIDQTVRRAAEDLRSPP